MGLACTLGILTDLLLGSEFSQLKHLQRKPTLHPLLIITPNERDNGAAADGANEAAAARPHRFDTFEVFGISLLCHICTMHANGGAGRPVAAAFQTSACGESPIHNAWRLDSFNKALSLFRIKICAVSVVTQPCDPSRCDTALWSPTAACRAQLLGRAGPVFV